MSRKIEQIRQIETIQIGQSFIATVSEAEDGQAKAITIDEQGSMAVIAHAGQAEFLKADDQVLANMTSTGPVILNRLRRDNELPPPQLKRADGKLTIEAAENICLQCGQSTIELFADGQLKLNGREIVSAAKGRNRLLGATVELN
ncbi:MAG: hypothetical protein ABFR97_08710 [Thermodesulfobacteriota bacterium]